MKCPNCGHTGRHGPVQCGSCHHQFATASVERVNHLEFMRSRLELWRVDGLLPDAPATRAIAVTDGEISEQLIEMGLRPAPLPAPALEAQSIRFIVPPHPLSRPVVTASKPAAMPTMMPAAAFSDSLPSDGAGVALPPPSAPIKL